MKSDPKILMIGGTHGNEPIGVRALEELEKTETGFDWIVGNPKAYEQNTRKFEGDLNRSAPGDAASPVYEKRRAAEILAKAKDYDWTIDLHGAGAYCGIFIILTRLSKENLALAARLDIPRIVYWPAITPDLVGPMSEFFPCGLEIECGPKDMPAVQKKLTDILRSFIKQRKLTWSDDATKNLLEKKELYEVVGMCQEPRNDLEEFTGANINGQTLYPLLIGRYNGMTCFTMKRKELKEWWA